MLRVLTSQGSFPSFTSNGPAFLYVLQDQQDWLQNDLLWCSRHTKTIYICSQYCTATYRCRLRYPAWTCWASDAVLNLLIAFNISVKRARALLAQCN